jgi:hypothetical protein
MSILSASAAPVSPARKSPKAATLPAPQAETQPPPHMNIPDMLLIVGRDDAWVIEPEHRYWAFDHEGTQIGGAVLDDHARLISYCDEAHENDALVSAIGSAIEISSTGESERKQEPTYPRALLARLIRQLFTAAEREGQTRLCLTVGGIEKYLDLATGENVDND